MRNINTVLFLLFAFVAFSQHKADHLALEAFEIPELGGIQSYTFGQHGGQWLIVGGRLDGLHRRQPFAAFDLAGHNNLLWVVDPLQKQKWTAPLSALPNSIQEQLSATNAAFFQEGDMLYILGGYGYSPSLGDHTTFGAMTAIEVPALMDAIRNNTDITPYFRQILDPAFAVTGGRLAKIYDTYHLVGGQKFIGRYNPMGPNHGPGFIQEYTNQIRRFRLEDDGSELNVNHLPSITDAAQLHRRDYNAVVQIMPNGEEAYTAFSGVFQHTADLPFLNCVNIDSSGYEVNYDFLQYYNHYHCANIPIYSATANEMHTLFFGGIAQFYEENGTRIQDDNVPFVKTIARVTRTADGEMYEQKLPLEMPAFLGAGSEFIPAPGLPTFPNGVIKMDDLANTDSLLLGYIFGGISSTAPNIFFTNDGTQSSASNTLFKVYLLSETPTSTTTANTLAGVELSVYPNPTLGALTIEYSLAQPSENLSFSLYDLNGKLIKKASFTDIAAGAHQHHWDLPKESPQGVYLLRLECEAGQMSRKIIYQF